MIIEDAMNTQSSPETDAAGAEDVLVKETVFQSVTLPLQAERVQKRTASKSRERAFFRGNTPF